MDKFIANKEAVESFKQLSNSFCKIKLNSLIVNRMFGTSYNYEQIQIKKGHDTNLPPDLSISVNIRVPHWAKDSNIIISDENISQETLFDAYILSLNETLSLYSVNAFEECMRFFKDLYAIVGYIDNGFFNNKDIESLKNGSLDDINHCKSLCRELLQNKNDIKIINKFRAVLAIKAESYELNFALFAYIRHAIVHQKGILNLPEMKNKLEERLDVKLQDNISTINGSNVKYIDLFDKFMEKYLKLEKNEIYKVAFVKKSSGEIYASTFHRHYENFNLLINEVFDFIYYIYFQFCNKFGLDPLRT